MVQRRAVKLLQGRRRMAKVTMMFKIIHHLVAVPALPYLIPSGVSSITKGHQLTTTHSILQIAESSTILLSVNHQNMDDLYQPGEAADTTTLEQFKSSFSRSVARYG